MTHEHTANEEARHGNRDALEAMTRERDRLREALHWYRANVADLMTYGPRGNEARTLLGMDRGQRARAALEESQ